MRSDYKDCSVTLNNILSLLSVFLSHVLPHYRRQCWSFVFQLFCLRLFIFTVLSVRNTLLHRRISSNELPFIFPALAWMLIPQSRWALHHSSLIFPSLIFITFKITCLMPDFTIRPWVQGPLVLSPLHPYCLAWCLAHSEYSINLLIEYMEM